jgi:glycosyltransferase involved in cell wall biosynthesis
VKGHYYGTPAARLARKPVAWWDHGIRPAKGEPRYAVDNLLPASLRADLVVTSSAASGARHRNNRVILPGIPLDPYAAPDRERARALLDLAPDERAIGIVGRLQPWKGQHLLLRAAPEVLARFPRARILVIGDAVGGFSATYPAELRALAADLRIDQRVTFLGHRTDVPALLPGLDVFTMASVAEPFGLVTVEAMAAGVPVVATRTGGTPEIVTDGVEGLLVEPGHVRALADAIIEILADPARAATMAAAGRSRAFAAFDITRYVRQIEDLVTEMRR